LAHLLGRGEASAHEPGRHTRGRPATPPPSSLAPVTRVAECPAIPGCVSQGGAKEEAVESIREAIVLCLEVRAERGLPLTVETRQIEMAV